MVGSEAGALAIAAGFIERACGAVCSSAALREADNASTAKHRRRVGQEIFRRGDLWWSFM
jgi:hypothetical protein